MPLYETIFITRQDVSLSDVENITANFTKILKENGGSLVKTEQWGIRDLAYPIRKSNRAYYTLLGIDASVAAVKELERRMSLNEDVMRHVSIKVEKIQKTPSATIAKYNAQDSQAEAPVNNAPAVENV